MKRSIDQKIDKSDLFIVLATKNYLEALRNLDGDILEQIRLADQFGKPFFMIIDSRLSEDERKEIRTYFSKYNIIKEMDMDLNSKESQIAVADEIKRLAREISGTEKNIRVISPYSTEKDID